MKYQSELIKEIVDTRGHKKSSLHYESECKETWIKENEMAYPKLTDYEGEWLNYINENPVGEFPYQMISDVTDATVENVVPYAYKSAILKGSTKYRDIDTGEILEAFEEGRNLELVSVKMPVLKTTGKNLYCGKNSIGFISDSTGIVNPSGVDWLVTDFVKVERNKTYTFSEASIFNGLKKVAIYDSDKNFLTMSNTLSFTPSENGYARFNPKLTTGGNVTDFVNQAQIQIEEGSVATSYEPHKSNILTVNEDVVLRGVGEVQDTLDCLTGEVVQNIGEIVLDGSEDWTLEINNDWQRYRSTIKDMVNIYDFKNPNRTHCDKLVYDVFDAKNSGSYLRVYNQIAIYNDEIVRDVIQFKQWLSQNPITIQYELATPAIKTVDLTTINENGEQVRFKPLEGTMHISSSGETIKPTFSGEIPVEAITQHLESFIGDE